MSCMNKSVLVTDVTVVEKAPEFRKGGKSIDVRGVGRTVLGGSHPRLYNQMLEVNMLWEDLPSCA